MLSAQIIEYLFYRKKLGLREQTLRTDSKILRFLTKKCDLANSESVLEYLSNCPVSLCRKANLATVYDGFAKHFKMPFQKPYYRREETIPFIPTNEEVEALINRVRNIRHAATLRLLKETGMRIGEACQLSFKDFDFERKTVRVRPEKHSHAREIKLSEKLVGMLQTMFAKKQFIPTFGAMRRCLERHRKVLAEAQNNPRFLQIHLHTFRHFKATMLYSQTKDILFVQRTLGHKTLQNTLRYTQLIEAQEENGFICKAAKSLEEASKLIEIGFEYVTEIDGTKLFRKRK